MRLTLTLAALAFASLSAIAQARPVDVVKIEVSYADLNLSNPAGAAVMLRRIEAAASKACGGRPDTRDMNGRAHYRACVETAVKGALAELNAWRVTELHANRAGNDVRNRRDTSITQR